MEVGTLTSDMSKTLKDMKALTKAIRSEVSAHCHDVADMLGSRVVSGPTVKQNMVHPGVDAFCPAAKMNRKFKYSKTPREGQTQPSQPVEPPRCYGCGRYGHFIRECRLSKSDTAQSSCRFDQKAKMGPKQTFVKQPQQGKWFQPQQNSQTKGGSWKNGQQKFGKQDSKN
jgi:hypothetical protein